MDKDEISMNKDEIHEAIDRLVEDALEEGRETHAHFVASEIGKLRDWTGDINQFHTAKSVLDLLASNLGLTGETPDEGCITVVDTNGKSHTLTMSQWERVLEAES